MKKILINRSRIPVLTFEREIAKEQPNYDAAVEILKPTGIPITDPDLFDTLLAHYTKGITTEVSPNRKLWLAEKDGVYSELQGLIGGLSFPIDTYTDTGKKAYIEGLYEWAQTDEEIKEYGKLKAIANQLQDIQVQKPEIVKILSHWGFSFNPYDQTEILITKHNLTEGIRWRKEMEVYNNKKSI